MGCELVQTSLSSDSHCYRFFFDDGMASYLEAETLLQALETIEFELNEGKHGAAKRVIKVLEIN